jgi:hypothetical protein
VEVTQVGGTPRQSKSEGCDLRGALTVRLDKVSGILLVQENLSKAR